MLKAMSDEAAISQSVHLLRHVQVENPRNILYGRQPGWKLSERGHEMAKTVATWSKELSLGAIHASPLERAQQTAAPIAAQHGLTIKTDENLIDFYNRSYSVGEEKVFTFLSEELLAEEIKFVLQHYDFSQRTILEVGCGSGRLASEIAEFSKVEYLGIDFSETAIEICNSKNLGDGFKFQCLNVFFKCI